MAAVCTECVHYDLISRGAICRHPELTEMTKLVDGIGHSVASADALDVRLADAMCGVRGAWFSPIPKPESAPETETDPDTGEDR